MKTAEQKREYFRTRYFQKKAEILKNQSERYQRNKTVILQKQKEWASRNKDKISLRRKIYTAQHASANRLRAKLYAQRYPDRVRGYKKKWADVHKHENLMKCKERRARLRKAKVNSQAASEFYRWIRNQDYVTCTYCGVFIAGRAVEVDHIVPINRGGTHEPDNFCVSCRFCNASKGDLLLHEWPKCPEKFKRN